jgi:hypothetical protein
MHPDVLPGFSLHKHGGCLRGEFPCVRDTGAGDKSAGHYFPPSPTGSAASAHYTPVAESHYPSSSFNNISNLIEITVVGQDIYSYAFHICLK